MEALASSERDSDFVMLRALAFGVSLQSIASRRAATAARETVELMGVLAASATRSDTATAMAGVSASKCCPGQEASRFVCWRFMSTPPRERCSSPSFSRTSRSMPLQWRSETNRPSMASSWLATTST